MLKFFGWILIGLMIIASILLLTIFLWLPDLEASQEPDWDKFVPIIIQIESGGNPNAISKANCRGLMQISEIVFKEFIDIEGGFVGTRKEPDGSVSNIILDYSDILYLYDPKINIYIGTWYLKRIWNYYLPYYKIPQTIDNLLIAWNWGIGNLHKYIFNPNMALPKETRNYLIKYHKLANEK